MGSFPANSGPCILKNYVIVFFFPRALIRGLQSSNRVLGGYQVWRSGPAKGPATQEAPGPLLPGAGVRAGASLQAAKVPVRPGERPPGRRAQTHPNPGENLVPEQKVQVQASAAGPKPGDGVSAAATEGVGAGPGAGRKALSSGGHSHLQPGLQHESHQPLQLQQLPDLQQLHQPRLQHKLCV